MVIEEEEQLPIDFDEKKFNHKFGILFADVLIGMIVIGILFFIFR